MNLRRHEQKVHKILPPSPPQTVCDECLKSFESLSEAQEHVELTHDMTSGSHCICCHTIFLTEENYQKTFAEEARIVSLGWHRDELFHCSNGKRAQREIAPIKSHSW